MPLSVISRDTGDGGAGQYVGVSDLMPATAVSFGCVSKCGSERADRCLPSSAH